MRNTISVDKTSPSDKKCSTNTRSEDTLMYHILTSDVHRELEIKLRSVISEHIIHYPPSAAKSHVALMSSPLPRY
jgi:hypothetical protein